MNLNFPNAAYFQPESKLIEPLPIVELKLKSSADNSLVAQCHIFIQTNNLVYLDFEEFMTELCVELELVSFCNVFAGWYLL